MMLGSKAEPRSESRLDWGLIELHLGNILATIEDKAVKLDTQTLTLVVALGVARTIAKEIARNE